MYAVIRDGKTVSTHTDALAALRAAGIDGGETRLSLRLLDLADGMDATGARVSVERI